jgi:hypothetical protein
VRLVTVAKTIDQLKAEKKEPKYLKMAKVDCDSFRDNYAAAIRKLDLGSAQRLSKTFQGMSVGVHHEAPGMCIIEDERQNVLLILMEKK